MACQGLKGSGRPADSVRIPLPPLLQVLVSDFRKTEKRGADAAPVTQPGPEEKEKAGPKNTNFTATCCSIQEKEKEERHVN